MFVLWNKEKKIELEEKISYLIAGIILVGKIVNCRKRTDRQGVFCVIYFEKIYHISLNEKGKRMMICHTKWQFVMIIKQMQNM